MASSGGPCVSCCDTNFLLSALLLSPAALLLHNMESCKSSLPQLRANQRDEHHNKCEMAKISAISIPNIAGARVASLSLARRPKFLTKPQQSVLSLSLPLLNIILSFMPSARRPVMCSVSSPPMTLCATCARPKFHAAAPSWSLFCELSGDTKLYSVTKGT